MENREDLHHMMKVLRLHPGDEIDISDSSEWEYRAVLTELNSEYAQAEILDKQKFAREPELRVTLYQGVPKQGKMELIIQKCVELGVYEVVPVFMARSVVKDNGKFDKKRQRWQKVADEAVKQCKRGIIPQVGEAITTKEAAADFAQYDLVLFPYENETGTTIKDVLRPLAETNLAGSVSQRSDAGSTEQSSGKPRSAAVIIGPEGGFSEEEAQMITEAGGLPVSLGKTILRTETAGLAALAMIMYELEL